MQLDRQPYKDCDIAAARSFGCDIVQLKYDGWWSRIEIASGYIRFYSRTNRLFREVPIVDQDFRCTLIGEHMQGTQWSQLPEHLGRTYIFDCWQWADQSLLDVPYRDRYRIVRAALRYLPSTFTIVPCYPIAHGDSMWSNEVTTSGFEGLVFRRGSDDVSMTLYRHKLAVTATYCILGFVEGVGKFSTTLGSVLIGDDNGRPLFGENNEPATIGGGFSDDQRREIWDNQPLYLGRKFHAEGRKRFTSGLLRHPNFISWETTTT